MDYLGVVSVWRWLGNLVGQVGVAGPMGWLWLDPDFIFFKKKNLFFRDISGRISLKSPRGSIYIKKEGLKYFMFYVKIVCEYFMFYIVC
jgi:hypothetical protein